MVAQHNVGCSYTLYSFFLLDG